MLDRTEFTWFGAKHRQAVSRFKPCLSHGIGVTDLLHGTVARDLLETPDTTTARQGKTEVADARR